MNESNPVPATSDVDFQVAKTAKRSDRRRSARASVLIPVRLRPVRFNDGNFEDVTSTTNVSRGSLNITTWRDSYYPGMRVLVTYPFTSSSKSNGWEYLAEVARMNALPDGRFQVLLRLQFVMQSAPNPRLITL